MTKLYLRPDSPYWWVTFEALGRRWRRSTGCRDRKAADTESRRIQRRIERGQAAERSGIAEKQKMSVGSAGKLWLDSIDSPHYSANYRRQLRGHYENHILPELGRVDVHALTSARLLTWRDGLTDGRKASSVNRIFATMRNLCRWMKQRGLVEANPCVGIEWLRERPEAIYRSLDEDVIEAWCHELEKGSPRYRRHDPARGLEHTQWVRFLCETGLRQQEGYKLRWGWVDFGRRYIHLPATACKGARARSVPLTARALAILEARQAVVDDALVWGRSSRRTAMEGAWERAGFAGRTPTDHDFRHTAASLWIAAGATLVELQRVLGHESLQTTERYVHLYGDRSAELAARIDRSRE